MSQNLQYTVVSVGREVFGEASLADKKERALRFLEEALELVQACGIEELDINVMTRHVYDRPPGDIFQELGGAGSTLYSLSHANGYDLEAVVIKEIQRVEDNKDKIRAKARSKPDHIFSTRPI